MIIKGNQMKNSNEAICAGLKIIDSDWDHVKSLPYRNGKVPICCNNVVRLKTFDVESGKEQQNFNLQNL